MSIGTSDERETLAEETTPPVEFPNDCRHSWTRYNRDTKGLVWRCGVREDGTPIMLGDGDERFIDSDGAECSECPFFEDTRIRYPLVVRGISFEGFDEIPSRDAPGSLAIVRLMEKGREVTRMGILLGDFVLSPFVSYDKEEGTLAVKGLRNPAIFVPSLGRVVWGCESWWCLATEDDLTGAFGGDDPQIPLASAWLATLGSTKKGTDSGHGQQEGAQS